MARPRPQDDYLDSIRLPREEILRILGELDEIDPPSAAQERRSEPRRTWTGYPTVFLHIVHPDGQAGKFRAVARNITSRGLGVLHGSFLYPKSPCNVVLQNREGKLKLVPATVVRCRHVEGRVHELGLRFTLPIDLDRYVVSDELKSADDQAA